MTSKEVSQELGISIDTLRYYERIGVIHPIKRDKNGYRDYSEADCRWLYLIKVMRGVGVSIDRLTEYVGLVRVGEDTIESRKEILLEQRAALEEKRDSIDDVINRLSVKIDGYEEILLSYERKLK